MKDKNVLRLSKRLAVDASASKSGRSECCDHVCGGYMDPALWSTLPAELLQMVFARLPIPQMCRYLRLLSKQWNRSVTEGSSALMTAVREAHPKMLALVFNTREWRNSTLLSGTLLYDSKAEVWHYFRMYFEFDRIRHKEYVKCASGGLVCYFISSYWPTKELPSVFVFNPLTTQCKKLPSHSLSHVLPSMVQLVVNHESGCYQVIVVLENGGRLFEKTRYVAMVYDSATGAWSSSSNSLCSCIFGNRVYIGRYPVEDGNRLGGLRGLCAFDGAKDEFLDLDAFIESSGSSCEVDAKHAIPGYALVGDRLFVLHEEPRSGEPRVRILEYQAQTCKPNWVKLRTHECYPLDQYLIGALRGRSLNWKQLKTLRLDACEGSLMVTTYNKEVVDLGLASGYKHDRAWLYDLCTGEWRAIAALEDLSSTPFDFLMCELRWDAIP